MKNATNEITKILSEVNTAASTIRHNANVIKAIANCLGIPEQNRRELLGVVAEIEEAVRVISL